MRLVRGGSPPNPSISYPLGLPNATESYVLKYSYGSTILGDDKQGLRVYHTVHTNRIL
jgi:hypothetical protein